MFFCRKYFYFLINFFLLIQKSYLVSNDPRTSEVIQNVLNDIESKKFNEANAKIILTQKELIQKMVEKMCPNDCQNTKKFDMVIDYVRKTENSLISFRVLFSLWDILKPKNPIDFDKVVILGKVLNEKLIDCSNPMDDIVDNAFNVSQFEIFPMLINASNQLCVEKEEKNFEKLVMETREPNDDAQEKNFDKKGMEDKILDDERIQNDEAQEKNFEEDKIKTILLDKNIEASKKADTLIQFYTKFVENNEINDQNFMKLSYYLILLTNLEEYENIPVPKKSEINQIKNTIPYKISILHFVSKLCFKNLHFQKYLTILSNSQGRVINGDRSRSKQSKWHAIPLKTNIFFISNNYYQNESIYAGETNPLVNGNSNGNYHDVLISSVKDKSNIAREFLWLIETNENGITIKNLEYNEYLCFEDFGRGKENLMLLTSYKIDDISKYTWTVEAC